MTATVTQTLAEQLQARLDAAEAKLETYSDAGTVLTQGLLVLAQGRSELAASRLPEARAAVVQLECLLRRADGSRNTIRQWGAAICAYEVAVLLFLLGVVLRGEVWFPGLYRAAGAMPSVFPYCVWGALGGVVAGLFGFYLHAARRDFDRGYIAYYFLKPLMGLVLGPLVYLFVRAGLVAVQAPTGAAKDTIDRPELLYLAAFVLGFGERFTLRLVDRVAAAVFGPAEPARPARAVRPAAAPDAEDPPV